MSIFNEIRNDPKFNTKSSLDWYRRKINEFGGNKLQAADKKLFLENRDFIRNKIIPGCMYFYKYDPKYKNVLPFYDMFPLTFIVNATSTHFTGINFHYLPYNVRFVLYDKLVKNPITSQADVKKIRANWELLSNASKYPEVQPAVKQYLISHVQSKFLYVPIEDMKTALMLPVEKFVGASSAKVQRNSMKQIKR